MVKADLPTPPPTRNMSVKQLRESWKQEIDKWPHSKTDRRGCTVVQVFFCPKRIYSWTFHQIASNMRLFSPSKEKIDRGEMFLAEDCWNRATTTVYKICWGICLSWAHPNHLPGAVWGLVLLVLVSPSKLTKLEFFSIPDWCFSLFRFVCILFYFFEHSVHPLPFSDMK